jgi:hypothetical protein
MAAEAASTVVAAVAVFTAALREAPFAEAGVLAAVPIEAQRPQRAWARAPMEAHAGYGSPYRNPGYGGSRSSGSAAPNRMSQGGPQSSGAYSSGQRTSPSADGQWHSFAGPRGSGGPSAARGLGNAAAAPLRNNNFNSGESGWRSFGSPGGSASSALRGSGSVAGQPIAPNTRASGGNIPSERPGATSSTRSWSGQGHEIWETTPRSAPSGLSSARAPSSMGAFRSNAFGFGNSALASSRFASNLGSSSLRSVGSVQADRVGFGSSGFRNFGFNNNHFGFGGFGFNNFGFGGNRFGFGGFGFNRFGFGFNRFGLGCCSFGFGFGAPWGWGSWWGPGWGWNAWNPLWLGPWYDPWWDWNGFYAPPAINYSAPSYQPAYDQAPSDQSPYGQPNNELPSYSPPADSSSPPANSRGNAAGAPQNPPASQPPTNGAETASPDVLLYLKTGEVYSIRDCWLAGGRMHYTFSDGAENAVDIGLIDLQRTVDENAKRGVPFTLRPDRSNPAPAPNANLSPQTPSGLL